MFLGLLQQKLVAHENHAHLVFKLRRAGLTALGRGADELLLLRSAHELAVDGKVGGCCLSGSQNESGSQRAEAGRGLLDEHENDPYDNKKSDSYFVSDSVFFMTQTLIAIVKMNVRASSPKSLKFTHVSVLKT